MKKIFVILLLYFVGYTVVFSQVIKYPETRKVQQTDDYFGTTVEDPYRWLEDDMSAETALWVDMQNETTEKYLVQIPFRKKLKERLKQLSNYEKFTVPEKHGDYYYYGKNPGLLNQSIIYRMKTFTDSGSVFFDPNQLSPDGKISVSFTSFSIDGKYMGYAISKVGSDWNEIYVMDTESGKTLDDKVQWAKFTGIAWTRNGFYYSRYNETKKGEEFTSSNQNHKVYFHKLGTKQSDDKLVFEDKSHPKRNFNAQVTHDGRYLIISGSESTSGNNLIIKDLRKPNAAFITLVDSFNYDFDVFGSIGDSILVMTNMNAPHRRIVCTNMFSFEKGKWEEIIPEQPEIMQSASQSSIRLVVKYMKDASNMLRVYLNPGTLVDEIKSPVPVTIDAVSSNTEDTLIFYSVSSFTFPSKIYRHHQRAKVSFLQFESKIDFNDDNFATNVFQYFSKDSTMVPMFMVYNKELEFNGNNPTLLFGYGGFNISKTPEFKPERLLFLENGGLFIMANIRGGGEFGEEWHKAGTKLKKQNVFDDFIAAAQYLIDNSYTNPSKLAISGRSNGGLLVGAVMTQRPDLFKVALPAVGVMDMLRFQKFTIGWSWTNDYGSSDNKEEFNAIYKYSPLHRLQKGVSYPATMVTTADHDDRVIPAHSFKFISTLQEKNAGNNPTLIRIDKDAGHGAGNSGKPVTKLIEEQGDIFSFMMYNLGMSVK